MELLAGKAIDRTLRLLHHRRLKKWHAGISPLKTGEHLARFSLLSSLITGAKVIVIDLKGDPSPHPYYPILHKLSHPSILSDYGFGWSNGRDIFLPVCIAEMSSLSNQFRLARLLVVFMSAQIRWGTLSFVHKNKNRLEDQLLLDIFYIVENIRLAKVLKDNFPGIAADMRKIFRQLSNRRPPYSILNKIEIRVEKLLSQRLLSFSEDASWSGSPDESLYISNIIRKQWRDDGMATSVYRRSMVPFPVWGRIIPQRIIDEIKKDDDRDEVRDTMEKRNNSSCNSDVTEKNHYMANQTKVSEKRNDQGLILNIYDKILSWSQFINVTRPFDDDHDNDASKKADSMEELTTARVERETNSFLNASLEWYNKPEPMDSDCNMDNSNTFIYPEWDYRKRIYLKDHVRLKGVTIGEEDGPFVSSVLKDRRTIIKSVRRKFEALNHGERLIRHQIDGDSVDMDAAVQALVDITAGRTPSEYLFSTYKKRERDISVLFLVDMSMSTDTWVGDKRVIDHEKEAIVILCEAMKELKEDYAIFGFSGQTRRKCIFFHIKDFSEAYGTKTMRRLENIIPYNYTRMGAAIRHAGSILREQNSKIRLLFLISDGKPNDVDQYEGRYGIEDTRMAIKEIERDGMIPFCITVDRKATEYLPHLFGRGNYAVVPGAERLAGALPDLYAKIVRNV